MDGVFAALTFLLGLWDMSTNYCETGCLAKSEIQGYSAISTGSVFLNEDQIGNEIYLRRDTRHKQGPFQVTYGLSVTDTSDVWAGMGHSYTLPSTPDNVFIQLHAMTGLYLRGDGADIGGLIEFRSGIEFGYQANNGIRYGVSFDHRSNLGIYDDNPGLETIQLRVSVPLK